jgi:hypothetical protein
MIYSREGRTFMLAARAAAASAAVLSGHLLKGMRAGRWNKILFAATGALLSRDFDAAGRDHSVHLLRRFHFNGKVR